MMTRQASSPAHRHAGSRSHTAAMTAAVGNTCAKIASTGGGSAVVCRSDFKSEWGRQTASGGFDSHPPPPKRPEQVLAYLSRYTHRVAISNSRLVSADTWGVTFTYKDYRIEGPERYKTMTLETGEFIRRFLMHVLPKGFHRIRHYGLLANGGTTRADKLARARQLIAAAPQIAPSTKSPHNDGTCEDTTPLEELDHLCPHCGSRMVIIETFEPGRWPRHRPSVPTVSINTS